MQSEVLSGLNHALSNRATAIVALVGVLEPGEAPGVELLEAVRQESRRFNTLLRLFRRLPQSSAKAQPVRLSELLPQVIALHEHYSAARDVPCELADAVPDALPVLAVEQRLTHALVALLSAAKERVVAGEGSGVRLSCTGDERALTVAVEVVGDSGASVGTGVGTGVDAAGLAPATTIDVARLAEWLLGEAEATVVERVGGAGYELRMPTLLELKREGKR
jgi:signal transduction histidine kinase